MCVSLFDLSYPSVVTRGVKQGCTIAPALHNTYGQCITLLIDTSQSEYTRVNINYRIERRLFNLSKLKTRTNGSESSFSELQYADDCALPSHSPDDLQAALSQMAHLYERMGQQINIRRKGVKGGRKNHLAGAGAQKCFLLQISRQQHFCQLETGRWNRLPKRTRHCSVWSSYQACVNHSWLSLEIKILVYQAACISSLLYCSESLALYRRQTKLLEHYHISTLQKSLNNL